MFFFFLNKLLFILKFAEHYVLLFNLPLAGFQNFSHFREVAFKNFVLSLQYIDHLTLIRVVEHKPINCLFKVFHAPECFLKLKLLKVEHSLVLRVLNEHGLLVDLTV